MNISHTLERMLERFDNWGVVVEKITTVLLALLAGNCLVLFFLVEGYEFNFGLFQVHAYSLHKWMLVFWVVALMKIVLVAWRTRQPLGQLLRTPLLLCLAVGSVYLVSESPVWGDNEATKYLPYSIIREFDFDLDEFPVLHESVALFKSPGAIVDEVPESRKSQKRYTVAHRGGHLVGTYPPWTAVLAVPVYLPTVLKGEAANYKVVDALEKRAAALIAVLAVAVFYATVRRLTTEKVAWAVTLIYALGTSTFSTSSQALWQHGPAQLFLTMVAYCLFRAVENPQFIMYAGLAMGSAILCRPLDVVVALPILGFVFHKHRTHFLNFLLGGIPPFILFISYNYVYFGNPVVTGVSAKVISPTDFPVAWFSTPLMKGLSLTLISAWKGLFIYSPILLCSLLEMALVWRRSGQYLLKYLSLVPLFLLVPVVKLVPDMGADYGPRLLTEVTPFLCLFLFPIFEQCNQRKFLRWTLWGLAGFSIVMHALGGLSDQSWPFTAQAYDQSPDRYWSWTSNPPVYYAKRVLQYIGQAINSID